jgi:hypothetical protein
LLKKKLGQDISKNSEKISDVTIFKNQYFLNNKNTLFGKFHFQRPRIKKIVVFVVSVVSVVFLIDILYENTFPKRPRTWFYR